MSDLTTPNLHQLGLDRGRGNLLGIEPYITPHDYASPAALFNKLNLYLDIAKRTGWLTAKTIVIFPEYIGTWLVLAGESAHILQAPTQAAAQRALVLRHWLKFGLGFLRATEKGRAEASLFRLKAPVMAASYQQVFCQLARQYVVTLVAGSIILPAPQLTSQGLLPSNGPLHNLSMVCQPDGTPYPQPVYKAFPTAEEQPFLMPAAAADLPAFDTPAGRLGVLICADSWYPQSYEAARKQQVDLLAVPSYDALGAPYWHQPWAGYNGWPLPADVDRSDIRTLTEAQAWQRYSLAGRMQTSGARCGMNVFLRGQLWDQDLGCKPATLVRDGEVLTEEPTQQAAILNLWI